MSQLLTNSVNHIETHTATGSALTIMHCLAAYLLNFVSNGRVNPLVMDFFQLGAWVIAILCGVITLVGFLKHKALPAIVSVFKKAAPKQSLPHAHPPHSKKIQ